MSKNCVNISSNISEMQMQKILAYIGFSAKSGKIVYGKDMLREYIKDTRIKTKIVLIASDAGIRVKKDLKIRCEISNVPFLEIFNKSVLSKAAGLKEVAAVGIVDENLAKSIIEVLNS